MERVIHTPEGVRDIYGGECARKRVLLKKLHKVFVSYGYEDIETPTFEYFDVFSREIGTIPSKDLYKFFDREGDTLVLRPDFTPSVARAASRHFIEEGQRQTVRLCYQGNTFLNSSSYQGRPREVTEMGVEMMGDASADSDAEVLAMMIDLLKAAGLEDFQVSVGQVDFFKSLLEEAAMPSETVEELRELISIKNHFGVEECVRRQDLSPELTAVFSEMPHFFGSMEILGKAKTMTRNAKALAAIERLEEIYRILEMYGCSQYITFDLGMLSKYRYYTGIIMQAFTYGTGQPILKGGRYNQLLGYFGKNCPSIGFTLVMEHLMNALDRQGIEVPLTWKTEVIAYGEEDRRAAIERAVSLRREGKHVVLQKRGTTL
ncbi:MAG: ATP phosphoribosyltransferase regulatory subunit [Lachnospiraceae bacterium]|jgi:ATP phosphoribosyltransferase, regulatory subunit|nr:ATP phosphoribosyltransferase regulatory subunit [Lachnospiraceae bacterium]MCI9389903.1 ATP phosphoribosyltransferase regulatory subunit [Lachnospiraceae bacterium]